MTEVIMALMMLCQTTYPDGDLAMPKRLQCEKVMYKCVNKKAKGKVTGSAPHKAFKYCYEELRGD